MKKYICYIFAVLLVAASLCGCKKSNVNPDAEVPATTAAAGAAADATEVTSATDAGEEQKDAEGTGTFGIAEGYEGSFVPSVTYKGSPLVITATMNGNDVMACLVVTNVQQAKNMETDISEEDAKFLVDVYEKLLDGTMVLPIDGDYVIREFVNVDFAYHDCILREDHNRKDESLSEENVILTVKFDLSIDASQKFMVMAYVNGEWVEVPATNDGNGHIVCEFEEICPVAFVILK